MTHSLHFSGDFLCHDDPESIGPSERPISVYQALLPFRGDLEQLKVLDPACGSGAFLIQSFELLMKERLWVSNEMARLEGQQRSLFDPEANMRSILASNIYGVDVNSESVEITRLALWLRTALPDRPLTSLDNNIRDGNSLVGPDFYNSEQGQFQFSLDERERINTFDWQAAFPEVWQRGGFDCIVGNPPYVKLQHFRRYQPQVAEYLAEGRDDDDDPLYASTQTGSFDLYLPFLEKGTRLINNRGRMGFISPSLWPLNQYGDGLKNYLLETHKLDRWVDFKYYQVFDEAITYTSLQFFRGTPLDVVRYVACPRGERDLAAVEWDHPQGTIPYAELPADDAWILQPDRTRAFLNRLRQQFRRLGDDNLTTAIFQGIKTSADPVYVLKRLGRNRYLFQEDEIREEVEIEDEICRPIASGFAVKRYVDPIVSEFLLFPYDLSLPRPALYSQGVMEQRFPLAWAYLQQHETRLRARESGRFDDDNWYCFSRPQNLDKQPRPKLLVAGTAPELRVSRDEGGWLSTMGGRVYSILPADGINPDYLLAILNSAVANFYFTHTARPKGGGFFDAETQYISPIPVPCSSSAQQEQFARLASDLRRLCTQQRDAELRLEAALANSQAFDEEKPIEWIWADIHDRNYWREQNPDGLAGRQLTSWVRDKIKSLTEAHLQLLQSQFRPAVTLDAKLNGRELSVLVDDVPAISIFPGDNEQEAAYVAAQWKHLCRNTNVTESFSAKQFVTQLLTLRATNENALRTEVLAIDREIDQLTERIAEIETQVNELVFAAYGITEQEQQLILKESA